MIKVINKMKKMILITILITIIIIYILAKAPEILKIRIKKQK